MNYKFKVEKEVLVKPTKHTLGTVDINLGPGSLTGLKALDPLRTTL